MFMLGVALVAGYIDLTITHINAHQWLWQPAFMLGLFLLIFGIIRAAVADRNRRIAAARRSGSGGVARLDGWGPTGRTDSDGDEYYQASMSILLDNGWMWRHRSEVVRDGKHRHWWPGVVLAVAHIDKGSPKVHVVPGVDPDPARVQLLPSVDRMPAWPGAHVSGQPDPYHDYATNAVAQQEPRARRPPFAVAALVWLVALGLGIGTTAWFLRDTLFDTAEDEASSTQTQDSSSKPPPVKQRETQSATEADVQEEPEVEIQVPAVFDPRSAEGLGAILDEFVAMSDDARATEVTIWDDRAVAELEVPPTGSGKFDDFEYWADSGFLHEGASLIQPNLELEGTFALGDIDPRVVQAAFLDAPSRLGFSDDIVPTHAIISHPLWGSYSGVTAIRVYVHDDYDSKSAVYAMDGTLVRTFE